MNKTAPHHEGLEPPQLPGFSKFVAGSMKQERSGLNVPPRTFTPGQAVPNDPNSHTEPFLDLNNPDAQFERYKNLMQSKYYNLNVNSTPL
jgi:hypothetical protein